MVAASKSTSSRKPRTAARAASRPATSRRAAEPDIEEVEVSAAEAQEVEVDGYVAADLCGQEVLVVPPPMWRASWQRALNQGNIDLFAEKILHPDDYEYFLEVDPTIEEWLAFVEDASSLSGESLGKSRARSRSGRPTPRR